MPQMLDARITVDEPLQQLRELRADLSCGVKRRATTSPHRQRVEGTYHD